MLIESKRKKKSKKVADSITYTTGNIQANIDHFNKKHGTYKGLPNVEVQKAAEEAAKAANTFASQSPDGASSISTSAGCEGGACEGGAMGESLELKEAKRYVRRYYIRPQNIFASNKAEILKALIDIGDENCSVYTLNNLVDNDDVTKLTNKDIIYYYDNGILYDKNHVKVMDYDLYIKHEEKRDSIDPNTVSDKTFNDVYDDRMTDQTIVEKYTPSYRMIDGDKIDYDYAFSKMDRFMDCDDPEAYDEFYTIHDIKDMVNFLEEYINEEEFISRAGEGATIEDFAKYIIDNKLNESLDEAFNLSFSDVNAYGNKLIEGIESEGVCCICGEPIEGYGNNPEPYMSAENGERCCDACNWHFVIPARLKAYTENNNK